MKRTIRRLNKALEDPAYRLGWISNMVQCHLDAEVDYKKLHGKTRLNKADRHVIANKAAYAFINLLKG